MKFLLRALVIVSLLLSASVSYGYEIQVTTLEKPYDLTVLTGSIDDKQVHLGELKGFPVMYQFELEVPTDLYLQVKQRFSGDTPIPFSLVLVKETSRGVTEIGRYSETNDTWEVVKNKSAGITYWQSREFAESLEPGTYRLEVTSPGNLGKYQLGLGRENSRNGYFEELRNARTTQEFFCFSAFKMLTSNLVYYPLRIVLLLILLQRTWKYRKLITND